MAIKHLYLPEKYKVIIGKGRNVGLCTVWSEPAILTKTEPKLIETCGIIGTLYSKDGINAVVRNLCLNPEMRYLLIWGSGPLSQTAIGKGGWELLQRLWESGVNEDGSVEGSGFKLHETMNFSIVRKMLENVKIIDVSEMKLNQVAEKAVELDSEENKEYMNSASFPDFKRKASGGLPSELIGWSVRGRKVVDAWIRVVDRITRYGITKKDEYGNDIKELGSVNWVIEEEGPEELFIPEWPEELKKTLGVETKKAIEEYINGVFRSSDIPKGSAYSYGNRLRTYPISDGKTIDQIKYMIEKFKECNTSRRVVASLWNPETDHMQSPPCLNHLQGLQTDGKLHLFATFRSHDIFRGGLPNAFALRAIQKEIANATEFEVGKLSITSISAHIYEQNWEDAENLSKCEIWERQVGSLRTGESEDVRGIVLVSMDKNKIIGEISTTDGASVATIRADTATEACLELAKLDLLSQPSHYMDIARQFQKAEIARDIGIRFEQDKPLKINLNEKEIITGLG